MVLTVDGFDSLTVRDRDLTRQTVFIHLGVAQLVAFLIWDQEAASSSLATQTRDHLYFERRIGNDRH